MCTKAVSVNVRQMSINLQANVIIGKRSDLSEAETLKRMDNADVLPTDSAPVITHNRPREIQFMRWGLVPSFAKSPKEVSPMYNARAETLTELRSFRDLIMTSRCLILNEGFYENEVRDNERIQWKISPAQEDYFYKAGLWTTWRDPVTSETTDSFTMITCDPGQTAFGKIHNRIPIIMTKPERRLWMNPQATKKQLMALLKPCDAEMYSMAENSRKLLKAPRIPKPNSNNQQFGFDL